MWCKKEEQSCEKISDTLGLGESIAQKRKYVLRIKDRRHFDLVAVPQKC